MERDEDADAEEPVFKKDWTATCPECKKDARLSLAVDFTEAEHADYNQWNRMLQVECVGCRIDIVGCDEWRVTSMSGTAYTWDTGEDFFTFDDALGRPVGISELDFYVRQL